MHSFFINMGVTPTYKQRITALFLTILFIGYVGNTFFFVHEHNVGDIKIVHSHPYTSYHNHTANSVAIFSVLSHIAVIDDIVVESICPDERLLCILEQKQELFRDYEGIYTLSLRAPPIL